MNYLYSGSRVSPKAKKFFRSKILKLSAYCPRVTVQLCIIDVTENSDAFHIEVDYQQDVRNCMRYEEYRDDQSYVSVTADLIPDKKELGVVKFSYVNKEGSSRAVSEFRKRILLTPDYLSHEVPGELILGPDRQATIFAQHSIWCLNEIGYNYWTSRFIQQLDVVLNNHSGRRISVDFHSKSGMLGPDSFDIDHGQSINVLENVMMDADDIWSIKLNKTGTTRKAPSESLDC